MTPASSYGSNLTATTYFRTTLSQARQDDDDDLNVCHFHCVGGYLVSFGEPGPEE
jgi:hypothetical protein